MYAICIETSHKRGMGHLFRAIAFCDYLKEQNLPYLLLINDDPKAQSILSSRREPYLVINCHDIVSDWETEIIRKHEIRVWIDDRLDTQYQHAQHVKKNRIGLVTLDDHGSGAALADIHIAALAFSGRDALQGKKVLVGKEYLILNREIDTYKRLRKGAGRIIITLGGSDTYGVTVDIVRMMGELDLAASVHIGPLFAHQEALNRYSGERFDIIDQPPSLMFALANYDLAITGGGVTPFEANASGLPCLTISSEDHERESCAYLHELGTSRYLGHRNDLITPQLLRNALETINIPSMSKAGMLKISTKGAKRIIEHIGRL